MVKFAIYLLVLVIFAYGSKQLGFPKVYFLFLVAILGSVAGMVLLPLFKPVLGSLWSLLPLKSNRKQNAEPQDINDGRFQKVLVKEARKLPAETEQTDEKAETEPTAERKDVLELKRAHQAGPKLEPDADDTFESLRSRFARPAVYAFRPYPPHREKHGRSKIGGLPDLPNSIPWPKAPGHGDQVKADLPLHFLAQIDLADLPWRPEGIPKSGMLFFFGRFDGSLSWSEPDVASANDIRVLYDADYAGAATAFPKNLPSLRDGNYHFDLLFGLPGDEKSRVFPEWPLTFAKVETMPVAEGLPFEAPEGYADAHGRHLTDQLLAAFGTMTAENARNHEFHLFAPWTEEDKADGKPLVVRPRDETGFPFAPRGIGLICRILRNRHAAKLEETGFESCFEDWQLQADRSHETAIEQRAIDAFIEDLNDFLAQAADKRYSNYLKSDIERAMHRLVTESGSDPELAKHIPELVYVAAADRHPVFLKDADGVQCPEFPGARSGNCYHQMFGHLSSVQFKVAHDSPEQLLLQLFSDWGAEMTIGDGGEFDFMINESDLGEQEFDNVSAAHCAH